MWQWAGTHDDVIKWKYFPRYWTFVRGIHRSPVNSPHKGQWRGALMFSLICVWINSWVNNREAGDLIHYRAHYDVTVMQKQWKHISNQITWLVLVWLNDFSHDLFWGYIWIYYTHGSWSWILVISTKQRQIWSVRKGNIQIKICAEYRDMLPRPRLVCQEPGLRPIGRSPGVPDKSSRGLGIMSRYSAQILICFIAYIFLFLLFPLWVWLGTVQDCHHAQCPLPLSTVIRISLAIRQSKLPACLAEVQLAFKILSGIYATGLVKLTDKMDEICINGKF